MLKKNVNRSSEINDLQIKKVSYLQQIGIDIKAMYIIGLPSDTEETYLKTLKFSKKISSTYAQFSVFTPYPGTPVYGDFKELINERKLEKFNQYNLVFKHKNLSADKIEKLKSLAYFKFYFDLKRIFKIFLYFFKSKFYNI